MSVVGELFAGAALGLPFDTLYDVVKEAVKKAKMFKPHLKRLESTLDSLKPLIIEIAKYNEQLDRQKEEVDKLLKEMKNGEQLIRKCSEDGFWKWYKKIKYTNQLLELDESLKSLHYILQVKEARDVMQILVKVQGIDHIEKGQQRLEESVAELKRERENGVVQTQTEIKGWGAVPQCPSFTVGLDVPLGELKRKLLKDDGVSMLVLTAAGGCGKTTLAKVFCQDEQVKDKFKNNIFFVAVSKKSNLGRIIQELYQSIGSQAPAFQNQVNAVTWLEKFLKERGQNPLLLVLDDVWPGSESLLETFDELKKPDFKILVTSRSEFPGFGYPYHLESLNDKDANTLFHHSVSLGDRSSDIPEDLSRKIVEGCKGFPLAITVVGRSLRGKRIEFWLKRVREWSKGSSVLDSETELLFCLQSSLDALDEKDAIIKECFVDLGSFPEDQRIPAAALIDMWAELYQLDEDFLSIAILEELATRSLANLVVTRKEETEVDGYYNEHFVTQHDMLRDLAIYHTKLGPVEDRRRLIIDICEGKQPKWLTEHKCQTIKARLLSISSDGVSSAKWHNIQLPEAEILVLNFQTKNYALPEFVEKMDKLKVLIVTNHGFLPAELSNFELLGSLSNLKRIRLERILIPSITKYPRQLESLQKISLFMCNIGQAFSNCSIQLSDALPNLEEMNIDYCNDLVELPVELCDLISLKKLSITHCHKLSALPEDIGKLVNLEVLRLRSCTDLVKLPGSIKNLTKLNFLDISDCFSIKELPHEIGELSSLGKFNMRQCSRLQELPLSVLDLEKLQYVVCDEETKILWDPFNSSLGNISIKVVKDNINLNWLHLGRF